MDRQVHEWKADIHLKEGHGEVIINCHVDDLADVRWVDNFICGRNGPHSGRNALEFLCALPRVPHVGPGVRIVVEMTP